MKEQDIKRVIQQIEVPDKFEDRLHEKIRYSKKAKRNSIASLTYVAVLLLVLGIGGGCLCYSKLGTSSSSVAEAASIVTETYDETDAAEFDISNETEDSTEKMDGELEESYSYSAPIKGTSQISGTISALEQSQQFNMIDSDTGESVHVIVSEDCSGMNFSDLKEGEFLTVYYEISNEQGIYALYLKKTEE